MIHLFSLGDFAGLCEPGSLRFTYNTDAADVCEFVLRPKGYEVPGYMDGVEFRPLAVGDALILLDDATDECVFRGRMVQGVAYDAQAVDGEEARFVFVSDWYFLEQTAYLRMGSEGQLLYPGVLGAARFVDAGVFARGCFDWAAGWKGSKVGCGFNVLVDGEVPVPEGNGMTSCAGLMGEAARWLPGCFYVQRYGSKVGELRLTSATQEGEVVLGEDALVQGVSLTERVDMVPPVCALVGGAHAVLPEGGDVREPGAFVFAVPMEEGQGGFAGGKPSSEKMVIKGVPVPERYVLERGEREHKYAEIAGNTVGWITQFFPEFVPFLPKMEAAFALVAPVPKSAYEVAEDEVAEDADAVGAPANYSEPPWSSGEGGGMYVLTEGSFAASARKDRCLRGLSWCKASISMNVRVSGLDEDGWRELRPVAEELFPGRRYSAKRGQDTHLTARLVLECVLVNKRKRVYDPATNAPCSTDPEYDAELDATIPTAMQYRDALERFYAATRVAPYEGSVAMLRGDLKVHELAGKGLRLMGMRGEWVDMPGTVIRSVQWDVGSDVVQLSVGGGGTLSFDEQLQRLMLARRARLDAAQRAVVPFDAEDADGRKEAEEAMMVSPAVNASVGAAVAGKIVKPWTFYTMVEGEGANKQSVVWLAGGTLRRGGQVWHVEDMRGQVVAGVETQMPWVLYGAKPKITWVWDNDKQVWVYSITQ